LFYRSLLGYVRLDVVKYDPSPEINKEIETWNLYDNPKQEERGYSEIHYPVLLRDVRNNRDYFGVIYLGVYE